MTYILLIVRDGQQPDYIQGTIEEINEALRAEMEIGSIDTDDWGYYQNWQLLAIEDGRLTTVNRYECRFVPQFSVDLKNPDNSSSYQGWRPRR